MERSMFAEYLDRWHLIPDGLPIITHSSRLLPVLYGDLPAMLKIAIEPEESYGAWLMDWWDGEGAARVFAHEDHALLLERALGTRSLVTMAQEGAEGDSEACRILCRVVAQLHAPRTSHGRPAPEGIPLARWFQELEPAARQQGGILTLCTHIASQLLSTPQDSVLLHGDIHHGNVLDFGNQNIGNQNIGNQNRRKEGAWLAIDPKRLEGERGFDYANLFSNPDPQTALSQQTFRRRTSLVAYEAKLDPERLLMWIVAQSGLSAAWTIGEGGDPTTSLEIARLAADQLQIPQPTAPRPPLLP